MGQVRYELDSAPETTDTAQNVGLHESPWNLHGQKCNWSRVAARGKQTVWDAQRRHFSREERWAGGGFFCSPRTNDNVNAAPTAENELDDSGILLIKLWTANLYRNVSTTRKEKKTRGDRLGLECWFSSALLQPSGGDLGGADIYYTVSQSCCAKNEMRSRRGSVP